MRPLPYFKILLVIISIALLPSTLWGQLYTPPGRPLTGPTSLPNVVGISTAPDETSGIPYGWDNYWNLKITSYGNSDAALDLKRTYLNRNETIVFAPEFTHAGWSMAHPAWAMGIPADSYDFRIWTNPAMASFAITATTGYARHRHNNSGY